MRSHFGDVGFSRIISLRLRWFRLKCIKITYCLIPAVRPELAFRCSRGCMVPDCPAEGVTASFSVVQVRPPAVVMLVMAAVLRAHQSVPVSDLMRVWKLSAPFPASRAVCAMGLEVFSLFSKSRPWKVSLGDSLFSWEAPGDVPASRAHAPQAACAQLPQRRLCDYVLTLMQISKPNSCRQGSGPPPCVPPPVCTAHIQPWAHQQRGGCTDV